MKQKTTLIISLVLLQILGLNSLCIAQSSTSSAGLIKGIEVKVSRNNEVYYVHTLKANETVYSLARYFKVEVQDLLLINKINSADDIAIGTEIAIPINNQEIQTSAKKQSSDWIPLIYVVKKRETLYKLSSTYFPQKIEDLISRNNIESFALKEGRKMVIGWWGESKNTLKDLISSKLKRNRGGEVPTVDPQTPRQPDVVREIPAEIPDSKPQIEVVIMQNDPPTSPSENEIILQSDTIISDITLIDSTEYLREERTINYRKGIAYWDKSGFDRTNLFVMHNKAKPNSYIRLKYKVTGREVMAKVVCPIPKGLYSDDIDIIISPGVANQLGALDSQFQIQMDYYE